MIKKNIGILVYVTYEMYCQFINFSLTRKGNKKQINNEYCYEFVDRLKSLELKNFLYWFLFPETKIIFENY